ncbi:bifunctional phosphoribosyl-AMP cyclohydrolase/phosphoribosyl-ATP diphosphatase HisIE [Shimazuella kribbensis]|uniref:bifunctional phosphoribosyl-AMP cyclohydrolase/phosphoribosyl-ATP diphosphatase HisIE n=1 Tax=Shimazuella kribbensis TaxID=139808 RepID=UPI00042A8678|nr:bifunctional phosphoribosyl-AMP cyclohydrolase/phosphoribosyl-ATP diphosphatase HisIE [Shimazuella kribbensis]
MDTIEIKWDKEGLVPVIIQHAENKQVLTLAYMNKEAYQKTLESKQTWLFSRSRQELWHKGATSGNTQEVVNIYYDCDQDAILLSVIPHGPACHTGSESCFREVEELQVSQSKVLADLEKLIADRHQKLPEGSYTTYLFTKGVDKIGKKIGEEAAEVIIAAKNNSKEELRYEAADLFYHLMVLLQNQGIPMDEIYEELASRYIGRTSE